MTLRRVPAGAVVVREDSALEELPRDVGEGRALTVDPEPGALGDGLDAIAVRHPYLPAEKAEPVDERLARLG